MPHYLNGLNMSDLETEYEIVRQEIMEEGDPEELKEIKFEEIDNEASKKMQQKSIKHFKIGLGKHS